MTLCHSLAALRLLRVQVTAQDRIVPVAHALLFYVGLNGIGGASVGICGGTGEGRGGRVRADAFVGVSPATS